jgi:uncharacterized protein with HEPN domain
MSQPHRVVDYLDHMIEAANQAGEYVAEMDKAAFHADRRTQQAVILNIVILGEAATKILEHHTRFTEQFSNVPWRSMKGMRNRIAHGYFDINLDVVWETVRTALPQLLQQLPAAREAALGWKDEPGSE